MSELDLILRNGKICVNDCHSLIALIFSSNDDNILDLFLKCANENNSKSLFCIIKYEKNTKLVHKLIHPNKNFTPIIVGFKNSFLVSKMTVPITKENITTFLTGLSMMKVEEKGPPPSDIVPSSTYDSYSLFKY